MKLFQVRIKRARDLLLDGSFTKTEYDETTCELQAEKHNIEVKLNKLSNADNEFNKTIGTIFSLVSKAHELFKSSDGVEKRRIITILFPNLIMEGEKLVFTMRKPFDMFVQIGDCPNWLPTCSEIRTFNMSFDDVIYPKNNTDSCAQSEDIKFIKSISGVINTHYSMHAMLFLKEIKTNNINLLKF